MEEFPVVSLDSLMGGEIIERFKHEWRIYPTRIRRLISAAS